MDSEDNRAPGPFPSESTNVVVWAASRESAYVNESPQGSVVRIAIAYAK